MKKVDYSLYLCTDRSLMSTQTLEECVESAIKGGVTVVQLREKTCGGREFLETALRIKKITDAYGVPLIINDRIDVALASGADGVHLGQSDIDCVTARALLGSDKIIGITAHNLVEAMAAERDGADYIGVGAMRASGTKTDAKVISPEQLNAVCREIKIPIVLIGGINAANASCFRGMGSGIAVCSAIVSAPDVRFAAEKLREAYKS